jgi:hypothetical protein
MVADVDLPIITSRGRGHHDHHTVQVEASQAGRLLPFDIRKLRGFLPSDDGAVIVKGLGCHGDGWANNHVLGLRQEGNEERPQVKVEAV